MPVVQDDATLQLISADNIMFGTIDFDKDDPVLSNDYTVKQLQMPSMYMGNDADVEASRYRPFHSSGFMVGQAQQRVFGMYSEAVYIQKATLKSTVVDNSSDKSASFILGKTPKEVRDKLTSFKAVTIKISDLIAANDESQPEKKAKHPLNQIVYVEDGAFAGTFWITLKDNKGNSKYNNLQIMDWDITSTSDIQKFPNEREKIHWGHTCIEHNKIRDFYAALPDVGSDSFDNLLKLGKYQQFLVLVSGKNDLKTWEILPNAEWLPRSMYNLNAKAQLDAVKLMASGFES
ncbi:hypothetical protein PsAD2_02302 [Pseudovibrio axinellae]|uniref:Uncharacterized protein n=1 Tax=Pseudovibrio axinellae TaxID=989403 RepID=A0A165YF02_9HYPH|nr:hypothetical protein [Pseudovibrio axinellae]KZL18786.1 hypothetical protein PsAD2_02302 [Pseudovibrio axinellae]SEP92856.1 hypothetical protein SAMN05421798_101739 [Pseudovibrio axinellae]